MVRLLTATQWLTFSAIWLGIACGTDTAGTAVGQRDAGSLPIADAAVGVNPQANAGGNGISSSSGGMPSGSGSEAGGGDVAGGNDGAPAASDATNGASAESGTPASSGGTDGATVDTGAGVGGALCGPNGTISCGQGQYCDPSLGCVDCLMDSQCPASMRWCVQGSCVQCQGNSPTCDVTTGACIGCSSSHDCPTSAPVCDPVTQQCVQCAGSGDCAGTSTPACLRNRCVACATNADCPSATPYCSSGGDSGPRCVQCLQDSQCPPSAPKCNGGTCGMSSG